MKIHEQAAIVSCLCLIYAEVGTQCAYIQSFYYAQMSCYRFRLYCHTLSFSFTKISTIALRQKYVIGSSWTKKYDYDC